MDRCSVMLLWLTFSDFAICFLGSPRAEGQRVTDDRTAAPTNTKTERSLRIRVRTSPKTTTTTSVDSFKMCTKKNKNKCTKSTFTSWHAALWASLCLACAMLKKVPVVLSKQPLGSCDWRQRLSPGPLAPTPSSSSSNAAGGAQNTSRFFISSRTQTWNNNKNVELHMDGCVEYLRQREMNNNE